MEDYTPLTTKVKFRDLPKNVKHHVFSRLSDMVRNNGQPDSAFESGIVDNNPAPESVINGPAWRFISRDNLEFIRFDVEMDLVRAAYSSMNLANLRPENLTMNIRGLAFTDDPNSGDLIEYVGQHGIHRLSSLIYKTFDRVS